MNNNTRNQNIICFIFSAIGALAAFFIPFISYITVGTSFYMNTKNSNKKLSYVIIALNVIILAVALVCHIKQAVELK